MGPYLLPAIANGELSPNRVCNEYFHFCSEPDIQELSLPAFVERVLSDKPDIIKNNDFIQNIYKQIAADPNQRKIVRSIELTDLHIDLAYKVGSPNICNFPICCRDNGVTQVALEGSTGAGQWGDYECDIPFYTL